MSKSVSFKISNFEASPPAPAPVQVPTLTSPEQEAVYKWVRDGKGNLLLIAVAGSGKSTALLGAVQLMTGYVSLVCYNKRIQLELDAKARALNDDGKIHCTLQVGTFHSFGYRSWMRVAPKAKVDGPKGAGYWKFDRICKTVPVHNYWHFVKRLLSLAKQRGIGAPKGPSIDHYLAWVELVDHYNLSEQLARAGSGALISDGIDITIKALRESIHLSKEVIDFEDMVYMALYPECRVFQSDFLLVDEAQDLNASRRMLAEKMMSQIRGRALFVADPKQSIFGWTGADDDATELIRQQFNCQELPLSVSWRCPQEVVKLAQQWVPYIQAAPTAPVGKVGRIDFQELMDKAKGKQLTASDVLLCRNNAPLVEIAYTFIRIGVPCRIEGRDIGTGLVTLIDNWKVTDLDTLHDRLTNYKRREVARLILAKEGLKADVVEDKVHTLFALMDGLPRGSKVSHLKSRIESMFQDTQGNTVPCLTLSSIHKFKGMERKNVYLLGRNILMPSPYAKQDWEMEQESNLCYVAVTRAMDTFIDVDMVKRKRV